jgi:2-phospho-L-lactate guanylyltransferase
MRSDPDIWAVVPVKEISHAKQRLASRYNPDFRRELALNMCEDTLSALSATRRLSGIIVVTVDPDAMNLARSYRARILESGARSGHTGAINAAIERLVGDGRGGILAVPADIPRMSSTEIDELVGRHPEGRGFSIVPAHDRRGSNAILMTPPDAVPLAFGDDSFLLHLAAARARKIDPNIVELPGISLDIDNPGDLDLFLAVPSSTRSWAYLVSHRGVSVDNSAN